MKFTIGLITLTILMSCSIDVKTSETESPKAVSAYRVNQQESNTEYFQDQITKTCFAVYSSRMSSNANVAYSVPCDSLIAKGLIK